MKKSSIALGVAALMAGSAYAGVLQGAAQAIAVNPHGIGHKLVVPYFSVQGNNATLLNIVNHDTTNGKAVKVRFRGAANSDDLYDFQVFLSPGDVWTAALTQDADGKAKLTTSDKSCTLPASVNGSFITNRLDSKSSKSLAEQTREGYVEIINMADIPATGAGTTSGTNPLFTAIKHVNNVAPCGAAVESLASSTAASGFGGAVSLATTSAMTDAGFNFPTTGLSADWVIINQQTTAAWSGSAVALEARTSGASGVSTTGNFVFFSQKEDEVTGADVFTGDPLLTTGAVTPALYDLPDLSTPYVGGVGASSTEVANYLNLITGALSKASLANEFVTDPAIAAQTDLVMTQPTRRYYAAVDYGASSSTSMVVRNSNITSNPYSSTNTSLVERVLCVNQKVVGFSAYNREEKTLAGTGAVISPGTPTQFLLCGEAAVTSINAGNASLPSALGATLARNNIELSGLTDGWIQFTFTGGLPVIGNAHLRAANGPVNYGFTWPHKTTPAN